ITCPLLCFTYTATTAICPLSLHDALPICGAAQGHLAHREADGHVHDRGAAVPHLHGCPRVGCRCPRRPWGSGHLRLTGYSRPQRSEEHTSELQSRFDLVCRLLLEKKKIRS